MESCSIAQGVQPGALWCPRGTRWGVGGRLKREGIYVYIKMIHIFVHQKLAWHYKAIIFQLKKKKKQTLCFQCRGHEFHPSLSMMTKFSIIRWTVAGFSYFLQWNCQSLLYINTQQQVKNPLAIPETWVRSLGWEDTLEKGRATHSSMLAWRIPWTEEPGRLQFMGSQRIEHD